MPEENAPCPRDTTRDPKDLSGETSERMKKDVVQYHAGKIDHVLHSTPVSVTIKIGTVKE